jgi:hypothetical protein
MTSQLKFSFGRALNHLKAGDRVARTGWNGKGMCLFLVHGSSFPNPDGTKINYSPHIDMKTAQGELVPWVASQTDLLSEDWILLED